MTFWGCHMRKKKCYVVFIDKNLQVYECWLVCKQQVDWYLENYYKGYKSLTEAMNAFNYWQKNCDARITQSHSKEWNAGSSSTTSSQTRHLETKIPVHGSVSVVPSNRTNEIEGASIVDAFYMRCLMGLLLAASFEKCQSESSFLEGQSDPRKPFSK